MRAVLAVFLVSLISIYVFPQTVIKEKVDIIPSDSLKNRMFKASDWSFWDDYGTRVDAIPVDSMANVTISFNYKESYYQHDLYLNNRMIVSNATERDFAYRFCSNGAGVLNFNLFMCEPYNTWATGIAYVKSYYSDTDYRVYFEDYTDFDFNDLIIDVSIQEHVEPGVTVINPIDKIFTGKSGHFSVIFIHDGCSSIPTAYQLTAEIISGGKYGNLYDQYTGASAKSLTMDIVDDYALIGYHANGEVPVTEDTIVIQLTTTVSEFPQKTVPIIIEPPTMQISFDPSSLSAADTANVIIKIWDPDQKQYVSIPADQNLTAGVIDGCGNGEILNRDGIKASSFDEIYQPIKFIAADSIDSENPQAKIRISIPDPIMGKTASVDTSKIKGKIPDKIVKNENKGNIKDLNNIKDIRFITENNGDKYLLVKGKKIKLLSAPSDKKSKIKLASVKECAFAVNDAKQGDGILSLTAGDCSKLSNCGNITYSYQLIAHPNYFQSEENGIYNDVCMNQNPENDNPNELGGSFPLKYNMSRKYSGTWEKSWRSKACKNTSGKIQYQILSPQTDQDIPVPFYLDFVEDICGHKISSLMLHRIRNLEDVVALTKLQADQAIKDFYGHYCYPQVISKNGYEIDEVTIAHEEEHKKQYEGYLNEFSGKLFYEELNKLQNDCEDYKKYYKDDNAETAINNIIHKFVYDTMRKFYEDSGTAFDDIPEDTTKELMNERNIQSKPAVKNAVKKYIDELCKLFIVTTPDVNSICK